MMMMIIDDEIFLNCTKKTDTHTREQKNSNKIH